MKLRTAAVVCVFVVGACAPAGSDQDYGAQIQAANEELLNQGNVSIARDLFAPSYVAHLTSGDVRGFDFIEQFVTGLRTAFPDLHVEVEILAVDEDRVAWLRTLQGTHQSDFMDVPASGRSITWRDMVVTRYEAGKIAEEWGVSDHGERLRAP
jgi:steroid delta-isomerase-like uncharacterized protein